MLDYEKFLDNNLINLPFGLAKENRDFLFDQLFENLNNHHIKNCQEYKKISEVFDQINEINPFIPVSLFKKTILKSIKDEDVFKILNSSGTTGQQTSKIYLDRQTAKLQTKALINVMQNFFGEQRFTMLVIEPPSIISNPKNFNARVAALLGFSFLSSQKIFALNEDMTFNESVVVDFFEKHKGKKVLIFGFTFLLYEKFLRSLEEMGKKFHEVEGFILHGGGWKKLENIAISSDVFNARLQNIFNKISIYNYYGLIEQVGGVFIACQHLNFHIPAFSRVLVRNPLNFQILPDGNKGLLQLQSLIPLSYCGHSLLTEDLGEVVGFDNCPCGQKGQIIKIYGRIPKAQVRGCSDVYN